MRPLPLFALLAPAVLAAQQPAAPSTPGASGQSAERPAQAAAGHVYSIGITGFTGGAWQPSGLDIGVVRAWGGTPGQTMALILRLGSFVQDQAVVVGGSQGFFAALLGEARRPLASLATVGSERNPASVRLLGAVEVGASANANSPLPQGDWHVSGALLVGFSYGRPGRLDETFAVLAGPAYFLGRAATYHSQVTLRFQASLGSGRRDQSLR